MCMDINLYIILRHDEGLIRFLVTIFKYHMSLVLTTYALIHS